MVSLKLGYLCFWKLKKWIPSKNPCHIEWKLEALPKISVSSWEAYILAVTSYSKIFPFFFFSLIPKSCLCGLVISIMSHLTAVIWVTSVRQPSFLLNPYTCPSTWADAGPCAYAGPSMQGMGSGIWTRGRDTDKATAYWTFPNLMLHFAETPASWTISPPPSSLSSSRLLPPDPLENSRAYDAEEFGSFKPSGLGETLFAFETSHSV